MVKMARLRIKEKENELEDILQDRAIWKTMVEQDGL
jgi:hypothetical protein